MSEKYLIKGEVFKDHRGRIRFINQFDLREVVRFYEIVPANTSQVRGWQGHQLEKKWFYCIKGGFVINVLKVDNFKKPSPQLTPKIYTVSDANPKVLQVPEGHATAFKAIEENSRIQIFSNFTVDESKNDDFRFPIEQWPTKWNR